MHAVTRKPDGSFRYREQDYKLRQEFDHFDVVRLSDKATVGGFLLRGATVELDKASSEPNVVRAIAELLSQPRGILPLQ